MSLIDRIVNLPRESRNQLINIMFNENVATKKLANGLLFSDFNAKGFQLVKINLQPIPLSSKLSVDHIIFAFNLTINIFVYGKKTVLLNCFKNQKYLTIFEPNDELTLLEMCVSKQSIVKISETTLEATKVGISDKTLNLKNNNLDLCLIIKPLLNSCEITIAFNKEIYPQHSIDSLRFVFEKIIESINYQKKTSLREMQFVSDRDEEIQYRWGTGKIRSIANTNIIKSIIQNCHTYQNNIAIDVGNNQFLSYARLKENIIGWINFLIDCQVQRGEVICVYLPKCFELYELIIAIMAVGALYAPIDITHPEARVKYIVNDCKAKLLMTAHDYDWFDLKTHIINVTSMENKPKQIELSNIEINLDDPAYIIYTSGTTGNPKGVIVPHKALLNFIDSICIAFEITDKDRFLQFASLSFDVSIFEIFSSFYKGATLCVIGDEKKKDSSYLDKFCFDLKVTIAELPPVMLPLLDISRYEHLRLLSVGGEKFPMELLQPWDNGHRRIVNGYGPTEATVMVTIYDCGGQIAETPPIGRPIDNVNVFVLNQEQNLLPIGAVGELYISGDNLAAGYVNRSLPDCDKFCKIQFGPQLANDAYRTGDLVRWRHDGNLEILGRVDRQVKINGYRIELSEIEKQILSYPQIEQVVVMSYTVSSSSYLFAFFSTSQKAVIEIAPLKTQLKNKLPHYMIPEYFVECEKLPLNHSGKIDYKLLQIKCQSYFSQTEDDTNNINLKYKNLLEIVNEFIPNYGANIDKDFFASGANSISVARILAKLNQSFGYALELSSIYQNSTVKRLQDLIENFMDNQNCIKIDSKQLYSYLKDPWILNFTPTKPSSINLVYFHCAGGSAYHARHWVDHLDKNFNLYAIQLPGHDQRLSEKPLNSLLSIIERLQFELEPILEKEIIFIGHSLGALLAYELAKNLPGKHSLKALVVIASRPPNNLPEQPFSQEESDIVFIEKLRTYGGLPENILENKDLLNLLLPAIRADAMASENYSDDPAGQMDCPIYVYYGNKDTFVNAEMANQWGLFTKNMLHCIEFNAGHFLHVEESHKFLEQINSLGRGISSS